MMPWKTVSRAYKTLLSQVVRHVSENLPEGLASLR